MKETNLMDGIEAEREEGSVDDVEQESISEESTPKAPGRPDGLDNNYWDEESGSIKTDDLLKDFRAEQKKALDLRKIISQKGSVKAPKEISEYTYSEDLNDIIPSDSETANLLKQTALDSGLSKQQFDSFISKIIPSLQEKGILTMGDTPLNEAEQEIQAAEYREAELAKLGKGGKDVLQSIVNWGEGMVNKGILSKDELPVFQNMAIDAPSLVVLNKIMSLTGESSIPVRTAVPNGIASRAEVDEIIKSEAYQNGDTAAHAKVQAHFAAMNPN
jgi:hypothetical protein